MCIFLKIKIKVTVLKKSKLRNALKTQPLAHDNTLVVKLMSTTIANVNYECIIFSINFGNIASVMQCILYTLL